MSLDSNTSQRIQDISLILKDLLKVIKIVSMYPEDNPLPQSLKQTFSERLVGLVEDYGAIEVMVHEDRLVYDDETVYNDRSKEEALAGLFFQTGITKFAFKEGMEVEHVYRLLDIIRNYVNSPDKSSDLAGMFWEADIGFFTFATVEDIALAEYSGDYESEEYVRNDGGIVIDSGNMATYQAIFNQADQESSEITDDGEALDLEPDPASQGGSTGGIISSPRNSAGIGSTAGSVDAGSADTGGGGQSFQSIGSINDGGNLFDDSDIDATAFRTSAATAAMGFDDLTPRNSPIPDTTLILNDEYKLAEEEEKQVRRLLKEDAEFDMWESTVELMKEMLHQETEMSEFFETVTICDKVLGEFISAGRLAESGQLLKYFQNLDDQIRPKKPLWAERLRDARVAAGSRERLSLLADAINGDVGFGVGELRKYLDNFDWQALSGVSELLGQIQNETYVSAISDFLASRGEGNIDMLAQGIYDKRPEVVCNAISVLARVGGKRALSHLRRVTTHDNTEVRLALVTSLKNSPDDDVLEILVLGAKDTDPEIRREAVGSIVARRGNAAFEAITELINDQSFAKLDPEDKQSVLNAYSVLGGDQAVEYLNSLVSRISIFGGANARFYQEAAFEALARNKSEKAERLLLKLSSSWRPSLKKMGIETLQRRRELIYGEDDSE